MNRTIGIIADDLTGANDSGIQLTTKGIDTSVYFEIPTHHHHLSSGIVVDTNSRALLKEEAVSITKQASLFLKEAGYKYIYKKMDSTLRGQTGLELKAMRDVFDPEFIVVAPAFPALGRTTKGGIHYVNGEKIVDTEFSKDPKHPVTTSFIPALLEIEMEETIGLLTQLDYESEVSEFEEKLKTWKSRGVTYIVCDAETQDDLRLAAKRIASITENVIWAGSAGLAEVLPEVLGFGQPIGEQEFPISKQVMTVCGSLSQVTQNQVKYAVEQPNVTAVEINTVEIFAEDWVSHRNHYIENCLNGLREGNDIVLFVPSNETVRQEVKQIGKTLALTGNQIGEKISHALGEISVKVAEEAEQLSGFVLTGGDAAKDTSRQLGGIGFQLMKQVEAGIPLGSLIGTEKEYIAVTKAGAFGKEDSIYRAMQQLKGVR
ncbi:four-carbon acid sugar kinase family protein [Oceanobacillus sp. Castelsardo]|uniref:four-carbon acid sugar kinase family protein n=1 Tax=Oceanobacillus sp. Castelsardo TaxID=1851204 RepID=UPI000838BFFA|nr:four-carbon acid sugar kinase family protein [Oceanobacillus sp. Castelsardo]